MKKRIGKQVAAGIALTLCAFGMTPVAASAAAPVDYVYDIETGYTNDPVAKAKLAEITALLPADWRQRAEAASARLGANDDLDSAIQAALNPDDYECAPTALSAYVDKLVDEIGQGTVWLLSLLHAFDFPTYDALFYGSPSNPDYALREEAKDLKKVFSQAGKFFDTKTDDIQLMAMHGDMMTNPVRVDRMVTHFFKASSPSLTTMIIDTVKDAPALNGGDHPIFTLNAYAFTAKGDPDPAVQGLPDKMVFGDGIIDGMQAIGYGDVGPEAILGHEMAHHVQYERNAFGTATGPEATRRTELMADAIGTYFVTHKRGVTLQPKRVVEATLSFAAVGDCGFDSDGHHGTPNQRLAAAQWGANLAATTWPKGHILGTQDLITRFDAVLPTLVRPDAG